MWGGHTSFVCCFGIKIGSTEYKFDKCHNLDIVLNMDCSALLVCVWKDVRLYCSVFPGFPVSGGPFRTFDPCVACRI